ncbi:hypothetical protein [Treponema sp. OMZ 857]|uniref:hypothetical protein n=1 Tax=Treponema sp. OMZ 857 TaxID=1643513 RepID=UPI0020A29A1F|nr:hypothetical protein [Treponema sp. OMZ 857]UTC44735.1 hypothetical protein E4N66_11960 [Treponema sp. OMZ 857]
MKKVFLVFSTLIVISFSVFAQEIKFRIDGKPYNKQIYDESNNQITNFKNWELIKDFYISPDNKKMLVYHRPDKAKAFLMTLYNLETKKIIAECEPGWACDDVKWTKNYLIKVWGTSGGGIRFEYRSYEDLSIVRVVNSYYPFEDVEGNILIDPDSMMKKIAFYHYSDGTEIKTIDCIKELADKQIYAAWIHITEVKKIGKRKYKFYIEGNLNIEGRQEEEFKTVIEIEIKCEL